jgi:hypothetical protein
MRRTAVIASILAFTIGCDKATDESVPVVPLTDLSASPTVLFQVFGARDGPRAVPIAIVAKGNLSLITLDAAGWHALDSMVFTPGNRLAIYHRGQDIGYAEVVRGMWPDDDDALYSLPGCRVPIPQANLRLDATVPLEESVELLASSVPFAQPAATRPLPDAAESQGLTIAGAVAAEAEIGQEELAGLDFHARWIRTGAGFAGRTLLASYLDPAGGDAGPGAGHSTNVFVLAEDSAGVLTTSFRHTASGEARTVESFRLMNHADLDGDGVAEIIAEAWKFGGVTDLVMLKYGAGRWRETVRIKMDWCVGRAP